MAPKKIFLFLTYPDKVTIAQGACTYDVCIWREEGTPKAHAVRKLSEGDCVKMQLRGACGGGKKSSTIFADVLCTWAPNIPHEMINCNKSLLVTVFSKWLFQKYYKISG